MTSGEANHGPGPVRAKQRQASIFVDVTIAQVSHAFLPSYICRTEGKNADKNHFGVQFRGLDSGACALGTCWRVGNGDYVSKTSPSCSSSFLNSRSSSWKVFNSEFEKEELRGR